MKRLTVIVPDDIDHFSVMTSVLELVETGSSRHTLHFEGGHWIHPAKITHPRLGVSVEYVEEVPA